MQGPAFFPLCSCCPQAVLVLGGTIRQLPGLGSYVSKERTAQALQVEMLGSAQGRFKEQLGCQQAEGSGGRKKSYVGKSYVKGMDPEQGAELRAVLFFSF